MRPARQFHALVVAAVASWRLVRAAPLLVCLGGLPGPLAAAEPDPETLVARAVAELRTMTQVHEKTWGMGKAANVKVDQGAGKIIWTFRDGLVVEAPVEIVGTYNPASASFLWSWANHTILGRLQGSANRVRAYGEAHGIADFTSRLVTVSPARAWEFAALANHLAQAKGAYRANAGGIVVYVTFGRIRLRSEPR
jgi:hypothetical protein